MPTFSKALKLETPAGVKKVQETNTLHVDSSIYEHIVSTWLELNPDKSQVRVSTLDINSAFLEQTKTEAERHDRKVIRQPLQSLHDAQSLRMPCVCTHYRRQTDQTITCKLCQDQEMNSDCFHRIIENTIRRR